MQTETYIQALEAEQKKPITLRDIGWAAFIILTSVYSFMTYGALMDVYEIGILIGTAASWIWLGRLAKYAKLYLLGNRFNADCSLVVQQPR